VPSPLPGLAALSLACLLAAAGCSGTLSTKPVVHTINGHVTLMIPIRDAAGDSTGLVADSSATGIPIRFLDGRGLGDSVTTTNGSFRLGVGSDAYQLVAGPTVATSDTLGPFTRAVTAPELTLRPRGALTLLNSRFAPGAAVLRIHFGLQQAERVILQVRALDGTAIAHLVDGTLAAGVFEFVWSGQTDAATNTPPGTYWITCEGAPGPAPHSVLRPVDVGPGPVLPATDSRGARGTVIVTAP
jgi:hypothetical protein